MQGLFCLVCLVEIVFQDRLSGRENLVQTLDWRLLRGGCDGGGGLDDLFVDLSERGDGVVQGFSGFGFRRFHHERFLNDEREVHCRRMDAEVQECLGNIEGGDIVFFVEFFQAHDELVHADAVVGHRIDVFQLLHHVVGVEDGIVCEFRDAVAAVDHQIGQGAYHDQEVSVEAGQIADAFGGAFVMRVFSGAGDPVARKIIAQEVLASDRTAARTAAAVRGGEGLMQVQVNDVEPDVSRTHNADNGVQVGSVVVAETAGFVDEAGDFHNVVVKDANGVRVGQHQAGGFVAELGFQVVQIDHAVFI